MKTYLAVRISKRNAQALRAALEANGLFNTTSKIKPDETFPELLVVVSNVEANVEANLDPERGISHLRSSSPDGQRLLDIIKAIKPSSPQVDLITVTLDTMPARHANKLAEAVAASLTNLPDPFLENIAISKTNLLSTLPTGYCIYPPMLLLSVSFTTRAPWSIVLAAMETDPTTTLKNTFFAEIAHSMSVTHIAADAPIEGHLSSSSSIQEEQITKNCQTNILRSPTNFHPLFGDFGEALPDATLHYPSTKNFADAFWVSTFQNGIAQVWAPRYTMFSSGNVTEKRRVLDLSSVKQSVDQGIRSLKGCTAVDLFAGIGYFAFSYAKAGVTQVLCWDINPWSIEGLRRGAERNGWAVEIIKARGNEDMSRVDCAKILGFEESNVYAASRVNQLRAFIPPVRHVNCGMLPTASAAWKTAVDVLDPHLGGWLHIHETVHEKTRHDRVKIILDMLQAYLQSSSLHQGLDRVPVLEHVETVKSVGPRQYHIVLDILVPPRGR